MKTCTKCKIEKELTEFSKEKKSKDNLKWSCKKCLNNENKQWKINNKEKIKEYSKEYYEENKEKIKNYSEEWRINNKEKLKEHSKEYYEKNKDKINDYSKKYKEQNKEKMIDYGKEYWLNNKNKIYEWKNNNKDKLKEYREKYKEKNKLWFKNNKEKINNKIKLKKEIDSFYRIKCNIRNLIKQSIRVKKYKKNSKAENILGCSFEEFKLHLESKFESWMNWDNYGNPKDGLFELNKSWDIDHIIPCASALNEEELIKLNHYSNLQPLCSYINRCIKKDKLNFL
jgi:hypothetical protein